MANIIPSDSDSVFAGLSTLQNQAIVRPSNPPAGISGFLFDIEQDGEINLTSEITDHFVENNTTIQDNWALRPEEITLNGLVAELTDAPTLNNSTALPPAALPLNLDMVPSLTAGGNQLAAALKTGVNTAPPYAPPSLYDYFENSAATPPAVSRQSRGFAFFYALWKGRQLCTVETAFGIMVNMAILKIRAVQDRTTRQISEFTVTFKKIRTAGTVNVAVGKLAGRCANQSSAPANQGNVGLTTASDGASLLATMFPGSAVTP